MNVYAVPFVSPSAFIVKAFETDPANAAGSDVTKYSVIAVPPSEAGATQETWTLVF